MANFVGQQLGNYRVLRLLGRGGYAEVYLGEHVYLKSYAALKVLHTMLTDEESASFMQEARMLTHLSHQHIVYILDFAVDSGTPYLVLEYAAGGSLRSRHPQGSRLPPGIIISYVLQVASALQYAHEQGFIHRDVKPENLLLSSRDEVLLSDFGLAIFAPHTHLYSTQVMNMSAAGTSPYLAPEQLQGQAVLESDQYAFGAVVYEWLCGTPPFSGSPVEVAIQHYSAPPPSLRRFLPDLPASIDNVVLRALSKSPHGRFASVNDFAIALQRAYAEAFSSPSLLSANSPSPPDRSDVPASSSIIIAAGDQSTLETPASTPHALPPMPTVHEPLWKVPATFLTLIGREQEVAAICTLLKQPATRLLTLLGMGGIGKTRLSIEVASRMRDYYTDGVYFVSLAAICDANLVMSTIAHELGIQEAQFMDALITMLRDKHFLLILDNFEQVAMAAPQLEELLGACPHLTLLITSRSVLHLQAERLFPVPPLSQPDLKQLPAYELLMQYAAVDFFVQRTQALLPTFQLTVANAQAVASICVHLDGLPLALELAAAHMRLLSPQALLQRLSQSLNVLTRGMQRLSTRQQTLRSTLQWSYELLQPYEQRLFRLLSVFTGGCTLEAVEAICTELDYGNGKAGSILDGIDTLLDNCLLQQGRQEEDEPRLMMLETVREYSLECLTANGELDAVKKAYVAYYQRCAQEGARKNFGVEQANWFAQLEREHDNLRTTLNWLLENGQAEQALRLSNDLFVFWLFLGYYSEGRRYLEQGLSEIEVSMEHTGNAGLVEHVRARSIQVLGMLVINLGDVVLAETLWEESVELFRELGDKRGAAWSRLDLFAPAMIRGEFARARRLLEESLALFRELGDRGGGVNVEGGGAYPLNGQAEALYNLATVAMYQGEYARARSLVEESMTLFKKIAVSAPYTNWLLAFVVFQQGDAVTARTLVEENLACIREEGLRAEIGVSLDLLARIALQQDDIATAYSSVEESVAFCRQVGDRDGLIEALCLSGKVATHQGDYVTAKTLYEESLGMMGDRDHKLFIAVALEGLAEVVALQGEPMWAVRLWGAAEPLRETMGTPMPPVERPQYERAVAAMRTQVGENAFAIAWAEGRAMSVEQVLAARFPFTVVQYALSQPARTPVPYPDELTRREVEVLHLLAKGYTNVQIAQELVVSKLTISAHLRSIYSKLGVTSRSAATRYAIEHHLA